MGDTLCILASCENCTENVDGNLCNRSKKRVLLRRRRGCGRYIPDSKENLLVITDEQNCFLDMHLAGEVSRRISFGSRLLIKSKALEISCSISSTISLAKMYIRIAIVLSLIVLALLI